MSTHTITRTHNGGPDVVVHAGPDMPLEVAEPARRPQWTDPAPARDRGDLDNPWVWRALGLAVLLVSLAAAGVLAWLR